ncbi:MAG: trypsin-like peptidase domain-containing protein [Alphaproteobacteria bacterium]|nr:trypsin-like peptidase domain-containing protein [Alphaproteobacteria bacterium]
MNLLERLVLGVLVAVVIHSLVFRDGERPRRPAPEAFVPPRETPSALPPSVPAPGLALPAPSAADPIFRVKIDARRGAATGSAFSVDREGVWLTARHVVQDCAQVGLRGSRGWVRAAVAWIHPRADLAMLRTESGTAALPRSPEPLTLGVDGFGMGFPQGKPGAVHGRLMGRSQMQAEGRFNGRAPTLSWAEVQRQPDFDGSLGGISGGPMLDRSGRLIGVVVAESPRRGRFETIAPEVLDTVSIDKRPLPRVAAGAGAIAVPAEAFGRAADTLRSRLQIVQAVCTVK